MLWVYKGQSEFRALVLAARAGQLTPAQALDILALDAAIELKVVPCQALIRRTLSGRHSHRKSLDKYVHRL